MRYIVWFLGLVLGLVLAFSSAPAEDQRLKGEVSVGASLSDSEDESSRAAEYESLEDVSPYLRLRGSYSGDSLFLDFSGTYRTPDEGVYGLGLEATRYFSYEGSYERFYHRLDHDTLQNLKAHAYGYEGGGGDPTNATPAGTPTAFVYHKDFDPDRAYGITRSLWENKVLFRLPVSNIKVGFYHRYEAREGFDQARTLSKCSGCHVVAKTKTISEFTNEYNPWVEASFGSLYLKYSFLFRNFSSGSSTPTYQYLNAESPKNGTSVNSTHPFELKLLYDADLGPLPFARTPDVQKYTHSLKLKWRNLYLSVAYSKSKNLSTDEGADFRFGNFGDEIEAEYLGVVAGSNFRVKRAALSIKAKFYSMDSDELSLRFTNANGTAVYGLVNLDDTPMDPSDYLNFERKSALKEKGYLFEAKFSTKLSRRLKWRLIYEFERKERENAEYHDVTEESNYHLVKTALAFRASSRTKVRFDAGFRWTPDPNMHYGAADPEDALGAYPPTNSTNYSYNKTCPLPTVCVNGTYWTESSMYDWIVYSRRTRDFSLDPEYAWWAGANFDFYLKTKGRLNAYFKYEGKKNTETTGYDWTQDAFKAGVSYTLPLTRRFLVSLGYDYFWDETGALLCSALYHG